MDPPNWNHPMASQRIPEHRLPLRAVLETTLQQSHRGIGRVASMKSASPTPTRGLQKGERLIWSSPRRSWGG